MPTPAGAETTRSPRSTSVATPGSRWPRRSSSTTSSPSRCRSPPASRTPRRRSRGCPRHEAPVAVALVVLLAALNLRGVRESGAFFALPTYGFMIGVIGMAILGAVRGALGTLPQVESAHDTIIPAPGYPADGNLTGLALVFLLARAFSSGSAALTGVEAISNGVPAFRKPKSKNAATTLLLLGTIAITMLLSIIVLANRMGLKYVDDVDRLLGPDGKPMPPGFDQPTVMAQLSKAVFDNFTPGYYFVLAMTGHHPGPRREHRVQRFPGARLDPGPRRVHAQCARVARRPPRLQQRHHRARQLRDHPDRGLRCTDDPADPALHRGRLRLLQPEPARDDPALDPTSEDRDRSGHAWRT